MKSMLQKTVARRRRLKKVQREDYAKAERQNAIDLENTKDDLIQGRRGTRRKGNYVAVKVTRRSKPIDPSLIINTEVGPVALKGRKKRENNLRDGRSVLREGPSSNLGKKRIRFSMRALYAALNRVECEADKVPIMEHFVRRAYDSDAVLKTMMNKLLPDLKSIDAKISQKSPYKLILDLKPLQNQITGASSE